MSIVISKYKRPQYKGPTKRAALAFVVSALFFAHSTRAEGETDWWFDVELIVFKRNISLNEILEKFELSPPRQQKSDLVDLFTPILTPDLSYLYAGLSLCESESEALESQSVMYQWPDASTQESPEQTEGVEENLENAMATPESLESDQSLNEPITVSIEEHTPEEYLAKEEAGTERPRDNVKFDLISWQAPVNFPCAYPEQVALLKTPFTAPKEIEPLPDMPINIDGIETLDSYQPYLLSQESLQFTQLFKDIGQQSDLTPLLHTGWRQQVLFGQDKALSFKLIAGKNFAKDFAADGKRLVGVEVPEPQPLDTLSTEPAEEATLESSRDILFDRIRRALADTTPYTATAPDIEDNFVAKEEQVKVKALWQLEGEFKVYLENVGRTPYLHIASDLEFREPIFRKDLAPEVKHDSDNVVSMQSAEVQTNYLQSVPFDQLRRVISKQLHYFDHPLFGMVVHITRYEWPDPPEPELEALLEPDISVPQPNAVVTK